MSEEGDKTCPLCAEEMDLTDQQLKPCKCGYEICVWCWHHIMDMAEKDDTEGRCPACRTAYNKEKIVGTGANSGRVVSEINLEKRHKSHKGKSKTSEGRKQLGSVRVIQRNLVYVVGLPLSFAEEDLLQRRDYFGQYGKVLKVSISQTASGAIQQFANSTCSVYITYSKEEEAVRCIQSMHGFVLDGRPLRACFGTTKYCHAWLRNMPCSNPDCLYLHEIGSQEDSFTKDEIISAYTRTRVQQITGTSNSIQRRSGNVLPPPADEYFYNSSASSGKPITTTATNTNQNSATSVSPPNSSSGRSAALPAGASWGSRSSNNQPLPTITTCSDGLVKQKSDTSNGPVALCTAVVSPSQVPSLRTSIGKKIVQNEEANIPQDKSKIKTPEPVKEQPIAVSESSYAPTLSEILPIKNREPINGPLSSKSPSNTIHIIDFSTTSTKPVLAKGSNDAREGDVENMCSSVLSMSIHASQQAQNHYIEYINDKPAQQSVETECKEVRVTDVQSDLHLGMPSSVKPVNLHEVEDDLLSFDNQRAKDPEIATNRMQDFPDTFHLSKHSFHPSLFSNPDGLINGDLNSQVGDRNSNFIVLQHNNPSGNSQKVLNLSGINNGGYSNIFPSKEKGLLQGYDGEVPGETVNARESSIISDILSMDFDPWDDSLTSPTNLARLFGKTDMRGSFGTQGSVGAPGSRKTQHDSQSKFSFAREHQPISQVSDFGRPVDYFEQAFKQRPSGHDFSSSNGLQHEKSSTRNGFPVLHSTESDILANSHLSINKNAASRSQISAPPGFLAPSKAAAPPGFTPHDRTEQIFDALSANHMLDVSSLSRNQYHTPLNNNMYNNNDIEFMDPAILAVGRGTVAGGMNSPGLGDMMSRYTPQTSTYEEARFQSLRQRSLPPHQNQRFVDMGDRFSTHADAYGLPSRVMDHGLANNHSPYSQFNLPQSRNGVTSNGQWDSWNENQGGNNMGMAELLRNDRFGFNNFYANYEDSEIRMPTSGNLYNGAYGI